MNPFAGPLAASIAMESARRGAFRLTFNTDTSRKQVNSIIIVRSLPFKQASNNGCFQFHIIAEGLRAFVEANDPASHWPRATKARLEAIDPQMFMYVERLFALDFRAAA